MIGVQQLYQTVNEILVLKGKGGFANNTMFNDDLRRAQILFQNYCLDKYSLTDLVDESLAPTLVRDLPLSIVGGKVNLPVDFRHMISAKYAYTVNEGEPCVAVEKKFGLTPIKTNEWEKTHDSPIRFADKTKKRAYYNLQDSRLQVSFTEGGIEITYIKKPPLAFRAVTINLTTQNEEYTAIGTTNLVWNESDEMDFVDILLSFKSLTIRESAIVNWIATNRQLSK